MTKAVAVIIGDIHFTPATLDLASISLIKARSKAFELNVPLILNGDTLDTKAVIRAEVANRLIEILESKGAPPRTIINTGNHDKLSEKSKEHALNFLRPYAEVVQYPLYERGLDSWIIPYFSDKKELQTFLDTIPKESRLIMHQGVQGANLGHYIIDHTSLAKNSFEDFRVISSHYHAAQDIKCGRPRKGAVGLFSYIGNPYTLSFGEAKDPLKGYSVLMEDGSLERIPLNLRKHVIAEVHADHWWEAGEQNPSNLLWLKITGPKSELDKLTKQSISKVIGHSNFKLDLIPDKEHIEIKNTDNMTNAQLIDSVIENHSETDDYKVYLKTLWREIL